jgi:pimeloyl-ACP methyl ester carboxylesterase
VIKAASQTFVLVHGALRGGWLWDRVVPILTGEGHRAFAPTLPFSSANGGSLAPIDLDAHVLAIMDLIERERLREVVLVGHSYAGAVVLGVAERLPERIAKLLFLDACVPGDGESVLDSYHDAQYSSDFLRIVSAHDSLISGWPELRVLTDPAAAQAAGPTDDSRLRPQPVATFTQPLRLRRPEAAAIERVYIHCTRNRVARRPRVPTDIRVVELDAEHDAMVTAPHQLASLLAILAR